MKPGWVEIGAIGPSDNAKLQPDLIEEHWVGKRRKDSCIVAF